MEKDKREERLQEFEKKRKQIIDTTIVVLFLFGAGSFISYSLFLFMLIVSSIGE